MVKPKIIPKSKIGINKFQETLKKDTQLRKKEISLLSIPGKKIQDISLNRKKNSLSLDYGKIGEALNRQFIENYKKGLKNNNKSQLLHTHITKNKEFGTSLPSKRDILALFKNNKLTSNKYELISVIDARTGNIKGYSVMKIKKLETSLEVFTKALEKHLTPENIKNQTYKKIIYKMLPKLGVEIYFTPEKGYKLDKNFNFVLDK